MPNTTVRSLLAAGVVLVAIAAPSTADAALCTADMPGPHGGTWEIRQDGALDTFFNPDEIDGTAFEADHGDLNVNGVEYPTIPVLSDECISSANVLAFPTKSVGGMNVSRTVSLVDGMVRHVDTITNPGDNAAQIDVAFRAAVLGSQVLVETESGDDVAKAGVDDWGVFEREQTYGFLRWAAGPATEPDVIDPHDGDITEWQHDGVMEDASIVYDNVTIQPGQRRRFMHVSGVRSSLDGAVAAVNDVLAPLQGLSSLAAGEVVNWNHDLDGDGIAAFQDQCPAKAGPAPTGCPLPAPPEPKQPDQPQPQPPVGGDVPAPPAPGTTPGATPPPPPVPSLRDLAAPKLTLAGLKRTARRGQTLRPRIDCDEACSLTVTVKAGKRTLLKVTRKQRSANARTVGLKLKRRTPRRKLTVQVVAVDAAGNSARTTRSVRVS